MVGSMLTAKYELVNGSIGDPVLFVDYPAQDDALLFDAGENGKLTTTQLRDVRAVFITHHHIDHFIGFDRILRANLDTNKSLVVFGPAGTITKIQDRLKAYEFTFFPFQKVILEITEILPGELRKGSLVCQKRFAEPEISTESWHGPIVFQTADFRIEAALVDHTIPCVSYAVVERPGYHPDATKLSAGPLRPGTWLRQVSDRLRDDKLDQKVQIDGGTYELGWLAEKYFIKTKGSRVAFVTDTRWSDQSRPSLLKLAHRADRLYCDCFYAEAQRPQADKHGHMTAKDAAAFAGEARVKELVLMHFSARYQGQYQKLLDEVQQHFAQTTAILNGE